MIVLASLTLAVALAASVWTTAYALTDTIPALLWLDQRRREDGAWDLADAMHASLDQLIMLDNQLTLRR